MALRVNRKALVLRRMQTWCGPRGRETSRRSSKSWRHQAMVCGVALGVVGSIAASEDVAQEAFLIAWRKIQELREPERLRAWLRQIARNVALGHQRSERGDVALEAAPDLPDLSPTPDEQAASEEEAALVRAALTQLPEVYREPLILYYRENQSSKGSR